MTHISKHKVRTYVCYYLFLFFVFLLICSCGVNRESNPTTTTTSTTLGKPVFSYPPFINSDEVSVMTRYSAAHQAFDFSATKEVIIRAVCSGTFRKVKYYHSGVPRWQVNYYIYYGNYAVTGAFEPGLFCTSEEADVQYSKLIADGSTIEAGDLLGTLCYVSCGEAILDMGVKLGSDNICPMCFFSAAASKEVLALFWRDYPGEQICNDHIFHP